MHGVLLLDKPAGGSSNHALQRVKRLYEARKAGHTGSLDPLATGMLPICFGEATKLAAFLIEADKGYETTLRLGVTTDSGDADGRTLEERPVPDGLDAARFAAACAAFVGAQRQVPPMVSAIKVDGQRLYRLARAGVSVEREPRSVTIHALEVLAFDGTSARLAVRCSKGTYIRSLVTDIGERLGCGAHVTALRRTFVAPFAGETVAPETLERVAAEAATPEDARAALDARLLPVDAGLGHLPELGLEPAAVERFRHGQTVTLREPLPPSALAPSAPGSIHERSEAAPAGGRSSSVGDERVAIDEGGTAASGPPSVPWRVREPSGRLVGLGTPSSDGRRVAPTRVLQWD